MKSKIAVARKINELMSDQGVRPPAKLMRLLDRRAELKPMQVLHVANSLAERGISDSRCLVPQLSMLDADRRQALLASVHAAYKFDPSAYRMIGFDARDMLAVGIAPPTRVLSMVGATTRPGAGVRRRNVLPMSGTSGGYLYERAKRMALERGYIVASETGCKMSYVTMIGAQLRVPTYSTQAHRLSAMEIAAIGKKVSELDVRRISSKYSLATLGVSHRACAARLIGEYSAGFGWRELGYAAGLAKKHGKHFDIAAEFNARKRMSSSEYLEVAEKRFSA